MGTDTVKYRIRVEKQRRVPKQLSALAEQSGKPPVVVLAEIIARHSTITDMAKELGVARITMYRLLDLFKDQLEVA